MRKEYKAYKKVGKIKSSISEILELDFAGTVYASPGVINHINKRHGKQLTKKVKDNIIFTMEKIIKDPDYLGLNYRKGSHGSFELIKRIDNNIFLLGLEVDLEDNYIYIATMYPISESKMNTRIHSGRLISIDNIELKENAMR